MKAWSVSDTIYPLHYWRGSDFTPKPEASATLTISHFPPPPHGQTFPSNAAEDASLKHIDNLLGSSDQRIRIGFGNLLASLRIDGIDKGPKRTNRRTVVVFITIL